MPGTVDTCRVCRMVLIGAWRILILRGPTCHAVIPWAESFGLIVDTPRVCRICRGDPALLYRLKLLARGPLCGVTLPTSTRGFGKFTLHFMR